MLDKQFYLGRWAEPSANSGPVLYDPADLTTHAVIIGMTGSGKTGLLIGLLEEAALQRIPAVIIDPKGDLTNLLLHFPDLRPGDFLPWVDPEQARRAGASPATLAEQTAAAWREGLAQWDLGPDRLSRLAGAVQYTVFTPGSTAGTPVNLLASFEAPPDWETNREALRERAASTVTALLGLVGMTDIDPLRSREHILLSNVIEHSWAQGQSLDLTALIEGVTHPPFDRLGAFPLERFFPEKDRFELALLLNNFLAAPSFQSWLQGQPLDAQALLYTPDGKPRFSVFYLAHLSDSERMFFVTLLLAAVESWMRGQRGTSGLRALVAFDEIVGYLPPVANPPSRPVLLRLLKQARAFGLGLVLSTQNPTDLNYKALSNAGTWMIGRLQTERDKDRLLDGLQSLEAGIDRAAFERIIARLGKRQFLLHNVHAGSPGVFNTRWTMNYLAGPLTRSQIPVLKDSDDVLEQGKPGLAANLRSGGLSAPSVPPVSQRPPQPPASSAAPAAPGNYAAERKPPAPSGRSSVSPVTNHQSGGPALRAARPHLPTGVSEYFFPASVSLNRALAAQGGAFAGPLEPLGLVYKPALLAQAEIHFLNRKYNLDETRWLACLVPGGHSFEHPDWDAFARPPIDPGALDAHPAENLRFQDLPPVLASTRAISALRRGFTDWVYRSAALTLRGNELLKVYAGPDVPDNQFRQWLDDAMRAGMVPELERSAAQFDLQIKTLARKIERQQVKVDRYKDEVDRRKAEQASTDLEFIAGLFSKRKRGVSRSVTKRRLTSQARGELEEARKVLQQLRESSMTLQQQRDETLRRIRADWQARAAQVQPVTVQALKKDIYIALFGIAWLPYHFVQSPGGIIEAPAF